MRLRISHCLVHCYRLIRCHEFAFPAARMASVDELAIIGFSYTEHRLYRLPSIAYISFGVPAIGMALTFEALT